MKTRLTMVAIVAIVQICLIGAAAAQGAGRRGGGPAARHYDPATVTTVSGDVVGVVQGPQPKGKGGGVHVMLKTATETIEVYLGPSWYLDSQTTKIATGDAVEVTGSRLDVKSTPTIIAAEIHKGSEVLRLRDTNGIPLWSRGGRGSSG